MSKEYYKDPALLNEVDHATWLKEDYQQWNNAWMTYVSDLLEELNLFENRDACIFAEHLWYSHRANKKLMREQLSLYKEYYKC